VLRGPDGRWKLLLGGADADGGLVLLYESADPNAAADWRFAGVLHRELLAKPLPIECPCLIALDGEGDGLFALVFGLIGYRDAATQRRNLSFAYVGRFDGVTFEPIAKRELDFIADCYAFQAFAHHSGPMGIAWAANWTDVRKDRNFFSAMTFPRRLVWRDGALHMPTTNGASCLRESVIGEGPETLAKGLDLPGGLGEIRLEFVPGSSFHLEFAHPTHPMRLTYDGTMLELICKGSNAAETPRYRTAHHGLARLAVFIDVGLVEIFVDDGRLCGTKRIDSDAPITNVALLTPAENVAAAEAWSLRPPRPKP
jgi:beta-fructofuranosidase